MTDRDDFLRSVLPRLTEVIPRYTTAARSRGWDSGLQKIP